MPITAPQEEYIGQLLYLKPGYGWGWHGADGKAQVDYALIDAAGGCHVRVSSFFVWHNEVRGIIGKVEQPDHIFDGLWIVCGEMQKGDHDFTSCLCLRYDLELGVEAPSADEWPRIVSGERSFAGYGILAETEQHIDAFHEAISVKSPSRQA